MTRASLVHFAVITVVCALGTTPAAAQDTRAESASQQRAAKAQTSPVVSHQSGVFQRTFTWVGNKMEGSGGANDGLYSELGGMIPGAGWLSVGPGLPSRPFATSMLATDLLSECRRRPKPCFVATTSAPLAISGFDGGSNSGNTWTLVGFERLQAEK